MNRHFIDYAALPCAPLGAPKQPAQQPPADGEWKPLRPGYEHRTLAGGATEVRVTPGSLATAAPAKAQAREPAYRPEGFDFAYVDHKGRSGDVIPQQSAPDPGRVTPEDVHGSEASAVPAEWQSGPPPSVGWWPASCYEKDADAALASFWNGVRWTHYACIEYGTYAACPDCISWTQFWRGPRLTGADWPEPQQ